MFEDLQTYTVFRLFSPLAEHSTKKESHLIGKKRILKIIGREQEEIMAVFHSTSVPLHDDSIK